MVQPAVLRLAEALHAAFEERSRCYGLFFTKFKDCLLLLSKTNYYFNADPMSSKSEALLYQPSLKTVLAYHRLSVPMFKRHYSWGAPEKKFAARSYFLEFLTNRNANDFFGHIVVYSATRHDFEKDDNANVYLVEGQHRLVTVVLGALAVHEALKHVAQHVHRGVAERAAAMLSEHHELFTTLTGSNMEVKLFPGEAPVRLTGFIQGQRSKLSELKRKWEQIEADYRASLQEIRSNVEIGDRRLAKKSMTLARNQQLERVGQKEKELESICAWRSYQLLKETLFNPDDPDFYECLSRCEAFLDRMEGYCIQMTCLVPRRNGGTSLGMLESEAFNIFAQLNVHACPLP